MQYTSLVFADAGSRNSSFVILLVALLALITLPPGVVSLANGPTSEPNSGSTSLKSYEGVATSCAFPGLSETGSFPVNAGTAIAAADLNGDLKIDLVTANDSVPIQTNDVSVLLGNGNGGFGTAVHFPAGRRPRAIAIADFNNDNIPDLITGNGVKTQGDVSILNGTGAGTFATPKPITLTGSLGSSSTDAVATGDFNNDGKVDFVATTNFGVALAIGDGATNFTSKLIDVGFALRGIVVGDFNADTKADVAVTKSGGANQVLVLLGDGAGNLAAPTTFAVGSSPTTIIRADFNHDTKQDLAVANFDSRTISVLLGDGLGGFAAARNIPSGGPFTVAVGSADFNGDGHLDLVATNSSPGGVVLLIGDGTGNFTPILNVDQSSGNPGSLAIADLNGDSIPDIALGDAFLKKAVVMLATCNASSVPPSFKLNLLTGPEGSHPTVRASRFGSMSGPVSIDYATSDGTAVAGNDYEPASGTLTFAAGEIFKDFGFNLLQDEFVEGDETINITQTNPTGGAVIGTPNPTVFTIVDDEQQPVISINNVTVGEGNSGTRSAVFTIALSRPTLATITAQYATTNGLATAGSDYDSVSGSVVFAPGEVAKTVTVQVRGDTTPEVTEWFVLNVTPPLRNVFFPGPVRGLGRIVDDDSSCPDPSFKPAQTFTVGASPSGIVAGDFNGDSKTDLAASAISGLGPISILIGNGSGSFTNTSNIPVGAGPNSVVAADFTGDGKLDLAASVQGNNKVALLTGAGNGSFTGPTDFSVGQFPIHLATGDFNGDSKPDLATANINSNDISVLLNTGSGFGPASSFSAGTPTTPVPGFIAVGDFNGDSKQDLAVATGNLPSGGFANSIAILLGNGSGSFVQHTTIPRFGIIDNIAVGDMNKDGKSDLVVTLRAVDTVSVLIGTGSGDFGTPVDFNTGPGPQAPVLADFNSDGNLDVAIADSTETIGSVSVLYGDGNGALAARVAFLTGGPNPWFLAAADFDGDGKSDLAATNFSADTVSVLLNACGASSSAVQFDADAYTASEGSNAVSVTVVRTGDVSVGASVSYTTTGGTASNRSDYTTTLGTLDFASGESSKTITILLTDDAIKEEPETLSLSLSNPIGTAIGNPSSTTLTITDNDTPAPPINSVDLSAFFVRQHYHDFLNREPDASGLSFWVGEIENCTPKPQCTEVKRINVSAAFFLSIEFQQTGYLVERIYKVAFGSATGTSALGGTHQLPVPIVRLNEFLGDTQKIGKGVVVGEPGWEQVLENN
jgi:hypothetical protein